MNAPTEPAFLSLRNGMEYLLHHPHEPIIYSRKKIFKLNEILHQYFFGLVSAEINKTQEYCNFLHTYCDTDHARDICDRISIMSIDHLFSVTFIDWFYKETIRDILKQFQFIKESNTYRWFILELYYNL